MRSKENSDVLLHLCSKCTVSFVFSIHQSVQERDTGFVKIMQQIKIDAPVVVTHSVIAGEPILDYNFFNVQ